MMLQRLLHGGSLAGGRAAAGTSVAAAAAGARALGGLRFFAKRGKRGGRGRGGRGVRGRRRGGPAGAGTGGADELPPLSRVMRLFVARVHPDKFGAFPAEQQVNEESLSELTGFLSNVSNAGGGDGEEEFMAAQKIKMEFFVESGDGGDGSDEVLRKIDFKLRTTGGDCKHLVQRQLVELFETAGVANPQFAWDDKFWKTQESLAPQNWDDDDEQDDGGSGSGRRRRKSKKDAPPPRTLEQILTDMDPVLQAIAAVPWLPESDRISTFVRTKAFDDLEAQGWRQLRPAAEAIWRGERSLDVVAANMDLEHRSLVGAILRHTEIIEQQAGR